MIGEVTIQQSIFFPRIGKRNFRTVMARTSGILIITRRENSYILDFISISVLKMVSPIFRLFQRIEFSAYLDADTFFFVQIC